MQDESWITLVRNDTFDVPGGLKHAWRNIADRPASVVVVVPMRLARFLREIARPLATVKPGAPTPDEIQRFLHIRMRLVIGSAVRRITPRLAYRSADDSYRILMSLALLFRMKRWCEPGRRNPVA